MRTKIITGSLVGGEFRRSRDTNGPDVELQIHEQDETDEACQSVVTCLISLGRQVIFFSRDGDFDEAVLGWEDSVRLQPKASVERLTYLPRCLDPR